MTVSDTTEIRPFRIAFEDTALKDLYARLDMTRWPDQIGTPWQYGTDIGYLKPLCDYWRHHFDWRKAEARLNELSHYKTSIQGRDVHFIHQRSSHDQALPLIMTHGWPGSIAEFEKIIPMLTQPEQFGGSADDAFHVVCPSIPGYGFSDAPTAPGFDQKKVAMGHIELMSRLGYDRYLAQGGDWGSPITTWTAVLAPEKVAAIHLTLLFTGYPKDVENPMEGVTEEELAILENRRQHMAEATGYQAIQGTKPQTLGYGLHDSPVGLAAWITEKFQHWTDCDGDIESAVSKDELLTNIMIYWLTGSITSSARLYYESNHVQNNPFEHGRIATPTGCALFPAELFQPPRRWAELRYNIQHWSRPPKGGHFAALEQPELLTADLREFFRQFR